MTKSMTYLWFPMKATFLLLMLATLSLYAEDPELAPPPAQELQQATPTPATSSVPVQTSPVQQGATSQITSTSPANDAARFLAGLPVAPSSKLAPLTREPGWQVHARA